MATTLDAVTVDAVASPARKSNIFVSIYRNYFLRKFMKALFTIWVVITLIFFMVRMLPGNPIDQYVNQMVTTYGMDVQQARSQAAALFAVDLDAPVWQQYLDYLWALLHLDLGKSLTSPGTPVSSIIMRFLPWTIFAVGTGLILSFTFGILLGLFMALHRDGFFDHSLTVFASVTSSIPNYLIAILLLVWFGVAWKILPIGAMRGSLSPGVQPGFNLHFFGDALYHAALPIATYVLASIGGWMLSMKSSTVGTLGEDYVTVARARGLKDWRITTAYVGRNAALPLFTQLTIAIGFVMGGSLLIEQIFQYQGIGYVLAGAINQRDYPLMEAIFLVITVTVVFANFLADILYSYLDPRIKLE